MALKNGTLGCGRAPCMRTQALATVATFSYSRNSFLVVAYAGLLGNEQPGDAGRLALAARVIAIFGILLSIAWLYVSRRQWLYSVYVYGRAEREMPDVASIFAQRRQPGLSGTAVMAYVVPSLAFAMWLVLAILV
jgi:hypothetical protein